MDLVLSKHDYLAQQTPNMIEWLSGDPIQQKQGFRENDSTSARVIQMSSCVACCIVAFR